MHSVFADLHVHLGCADGSAVKISASPQLTLEGILRTARSDKGLDVVGVIDAATTGGLADLRGAVAAGALRPLPGGGLVARDGLVVLPGAEVELDVAGHRVHFAAFVPGLEETNHLLRRLAGHARNVRLSSQRAHGLTVAALCAAVDDERGMVWPAHAFTPHRGLYGCAVATALAPESVGLGPEALGRFAGVELGLSADTDMADRLSELAASTFITNSDAHSLGTMARECNRLLVAGTPDWSEVRACLLREGGRAVACNYGLAPQLGKYHRTVCVRCGVQAEGPPPVRRCPACGSTRVVMGVFDRLTEIADRPQAVTPDHRPPYVHQIPLAFLPGIGEATAARLRSGVGPELALLHEADLSEIARVGGARAAAAIGAARAGRLSLRAGGGGHYGGVVGGTLAASLPPGPA